jgi:hypothetical protein
MAMINVWYPKEAGPGIEVKPIISTRGNLQQLGRYLDGRLNVGHSSLLLDRIPRPVYVSWWPQAPATKTPTWRVDVAEEGGSPNVMISIDELDEPAIASWWSSMVSTRQGERGGYELVSNNCSTVVAKALSVGGAEKLAPPPKISMWTPARIEDWAKAILAAGTAKTNGIFRHEGIGDFIDSKLRRIVSELGAGALDN